MAHSDTNSRFLGSLNEEQQREIIHSSIAKIEESCGQKPKGWRSSDLNTSFGTPDILSEEGIRYISDWLNDDQPYLVNVRNGRLISLPLDGMTDLAFQDETPSQYIEIATAHFDTLHREGNKQARTIALNLHTFEIGKPSKIAVLDKLLQYIKKHEDVWFTTGWELSVWYYENYLGIKRSQIG